MPTQTDDRLTGWKAIGRYLGRDVRTAQLWERERRMPVHRIPGGPGQSVYAYANELTAWLHPGARGNTTSSPRSRSPGLLVLPFDYRGSDATERGFVGDAIASEVLNRLAVAPLADLRVLSNTTARAYRQSHKRADELAAELGIRYLVEGGIDEAGARWNIDIRVIDALDDRVVFADRFVAAGHEAPHLQRTIAEAVSGHLALHLAERLVEPFWNRPVDPAAFLAYIRSMDALSRMSLDSLQLATALADEALAIDPAFAPAYVAKATAAAHTYQYFHNGDATQYARVRALAAECIERAPQLATTQLLDARLAVHYDFDWARGDRLYGNLLGALPSHATARVNLANAQGMRGQFDDAQRTVAVASDLDRSLNLIQIQAGIHFWRREFGAALEHFDRMLALTPGQGFASVSKVGMLGLLMRDEPATRAHAASMDDGLRKLFGPFADACTACASGNAARFDEARREVAQFAKDGRGLFYHAAMLDAAAGDVDGAIAHLDAAITRGRGELVVHARVEPVFDALRGDPRFHAQLARLNLAAA
jgi:TolB-like protein